MRANLLTDVLGRLENRRFDAGLDDDFDLVGKPFGELSASLAVSELGLAGLPMAGLVTLPRRAIAAGYENFEPGWLSYATQPSRHGNPNALLSINCRNIARCR